MKFGKVAVLILLVAALGAFFGFDLGRYFSLAFLKSSQKLFETYYHSNPPRTLLIYFVVYVAVTALSLPGAAVMTLAGGALFGLITGTFLVSFASAIGATLAFLVSRYLLRDWVKSRFGQKLASVDAGIERDGPFYLFTLRLVPLFPFFLINLLMGLTKLRVPTFYWVSQIGMLPGTMVYVNAGTQLARIDSLRGILSPAVIGSFVLLGVFPLIARGGLRWFKGQQVYRRWRKPARFDRNLVVIGAGAAGLVSAYIAAAVKAKATLIEGHKMGGDCLNFGCVPSKALIRSAKFLKQAQQCQALGIAQADTQMRFADVMARVKRVIRAVEPHDSVERYSSLGVEVLRGNATIVSPWEVDVDGRRLTTRSIVIAAGAKPVVPPIPGLDAVGYVTSDTLWSLTELPRRLVVLGGGPIGCELAQAFARFGAEVTQVEMASRLLNREDADVSDAVARALAADGVRVLIGTQAVRCEHDGSAKRLFTKKAESGNDGEESAVEFDLLLCAVGRIARTEGYGLETLGIPLTKQKTIDTDDYLQTLYPNIYACGDVAGPYQFTHTAAHQAWYAVVNALFGQFKRFRADYSVIPWCTFTDPEVARAGLSEREAEEQGIKVEVTRYDIADLDRAITDEVPYGFLKVLTPPGKDHILGVTIVGAHAGELLAEFVLAMKHGLGLNKILGTIHVYPTLAEANKYVAGEWKRAHAPQRLLKWVERYHAWRRG
jgi:pyruvate/2-oxoglutarate dehydrogenase complex dihydrolipoamide dehydrogenase (E3) component/uncharacterized membrane protein YdjX (TVP38/TMEM64 family)